ncbi:hypothetical protein [Streptomyces beihaiensis]|uniref:Integral membrane protein n=1 Tax=Streptomyces beihaiensis TaxID=2984495 RepID=A0ABT3TTF8_9ACTN|nr:hypothetical protein [Streptomyces beihaiensis]MCX3060324.1 hypothetical protein [Streptomyces beihaiensis]
MTQPPQPAQTPQSAQPTQQPYAPFPQQQGQPTAQPAPGAAGGYPLAPTASQPDTGKPGLGILAAIVAAVVSAGVYGAIIGGTRHEIGYAAVGVGLLVGLAAGKVGGRNPVIPVVSVVLSLAGVYFGQLLGEAILASKDLPVTVSELFFHHFGLLNQAWRDTVDPLTFLFFAIAAAAAFRSAKRAAA